MCGRYALVNGKEVFLTGSQMMKMRELGQAFKLLPRYNASPTQMMPVIYIREGELVVQPMQWWLVPHWSKDGKVNFSTFNAKSETLEQSKLFSPYFKGSRCLIPAEAFYEWKKISDKEKQPICIRMRDEKPFMFAGLFSIWKNKQGEEFPTFTIITTEPNELLKDIHHRMPVILHGKDYAQWLDPDNKDTGELRKLLVPYPASKMKAYPVSKMVSNSRNDSPGCWTPVTIEQKKSFR